jgi:hypothetical protein
VSVSRTLKLRPSNNILVLYLALKYLDNVVLRGMFEKFVDWRQYAAVT